MAQLPGVNVNPLNGGLTRKAPNEDNIVALIAATPNIAATNLELNQARPLLQISDLENAGIREAYDANESVLLHYHVSEIFRLAPNAKVYLIPVDVGLEPQAMFTEAIPTIRQNSDIKGIGIVGYTTAIGDLPNSIQVIQNSINTAFVTENRRIDFVLLEGKAEDEIVPTTLTDLTELDAPNVSVIIGQDALIASWAQAYENHAAIGSALGMLCVRKVNENMGSVNILNKPRGKRGTVDYPLTDSLKKRWLNAKLTDGTYVERLSKTDLASLAAKGYIFASSYEGYGGIYFSGSRTCVTVASDYTHIENNRTWNKAARAIRQILIPEVKGVVKKDPQTGFIRSTTISRWQGLVNRTLEQLVVDDEISGFDVYINPEQYLGEDSPLKIHGQIVKDDIVHQFEVDLGYTQNI